MDEAVEAIRGLDLTLNQKIDAETAASAATAERLANVEADISVRVQELIDNNAGGEGDILFEERVIKLEESMSGLEGSIVTWDGFFTNQESWNCTPYDWGTFVEFDVPAGHTLDCSFAVSTDWGAAQNRFFMLGVMRDAELMGIAIDDSWTMGETDVDGFEDNGAVTLLYKGVVDYASTYSLHMHGGNEGCHIPWTQAQASCKTYGPGHKLMVTNVTQ